MAANPVPLIVPCHRVLAAGGKIGGFSAPGGSDTKMHMLELEGVALQPASATAAAGQRSFGFAAAACLVRPCASWLGRAMATEVRTCSGIASPGSRPLSHRCEGAI